jgi:hypothetical protein
MMPNGTFRLIRSGIGQYNVCLAMAIISRKGAKLQILFLAFFDQAKREILLIQQHFELRNFIRTISCLPIAVCRLTIHVRRLPIAV